MNIECPNCHAAYVVPDSRLGTRRVVRCGTCEHAWTVKEAAPATEAPADAVSQDPSDRRHHVRHPSGDLDEPSASQAPAATTAGDRLVPARPAAPQRNALLASAWAASVLLIVGTGTAAYTWRGDVDAMWPPAARILGTPSR
ncbi:MAG TPA: MJ0042-type zinc finger domain-containing protein, partial [Rhodopila sp.]|nr:MJ0042-type zinc finger domain-containing protein [Rhodopila sp.]